MKTKKDLILESFKTMNFDMLEILLDDNKTYQDATKEVFLDKVHIAFTKLKASGDNSLKSYKGFCNSDNCTNKGCSGYSFIGNNSKNHIDLIFDEENDDVKDIYNCYQFKTIDKSVDKEDFINIEIMEDEKADFNPNIDFLIKSQNYNKAFDELMKFQHNIIDKNIYVHWLKKYYFLYESFGFSDSLFNNLKKFNSLYYEINELKDFLKSNKSAKKAIKEYNTLDIHNELELLKWLVKYEKIGENLILFLYEDIDFEKPEEKEYFELKNLKIKTSDFKHIAKFKFLFDNQYWDKLKKYTTFTEEDKIRFSNERDERSDYITILSYHLNKRGITF